MFVVELKYVDGEHELTILESQNRELIERVAGVSLGEYERAAQKEEDSVLAALIQGEARKARAVLRAGGFEAE